MAEYTDENEIEIEVLLREQKHAALGFLSDAIDEAVANGIQPDIVLNAALFASISELVTVYGEDAVGEMAAALPDRIQNGEFSLARSIQ
jgi:hypothetical protein